jgi:hypothetical protein
MDLKHLEDLLAQLQCLAAAEQRRADYKDSSRASSYQLAIVLREAAEVVQEAVVAKRKAALSMQ